MPPPRNRERELLQVRLHAGGIELAIAQAEQLERATPPHPPLARVRLHGSHNGSQRATIDLGGHLSLEPADPSALGLF